MLQKHIVITLGDGSCKVTTMSLVGRSPRLPVGAEYVRPDSAVWVRGPTREAVEAELAVVSPAMEAQGFGKIVSWRFAEDRELPSILGNTNAVYNDARVDLGAAVGIGYNMEKARDAHREWLRGQRKAEFTKLDGDWMKAVGTDDKATAQTAEAARQVLRDITDDPRIDAAQTIDDLKAVTLPTRG